MFCINLRIIILVHRENVVIPDAKRKLNSGWYVGDSVFFCWFYHGLHCRSNTPDPFRSPLPLPFPEASTKSSTTYKIHAFAHNRHSTRMLKFKIEATSFALIWLTVHCRMHEESFSITCLSDLDILTRSGGICDPSLKLCEINPHFELWSTNKKLKVIDAHVDPPKWTFLCPGPSSFYTC